MSNKEKLYDTSYLPLSDKRIVSRSSSSPATDCLTRHQYGCRPGEYYTVLIYNKMHKDGKYVHYWSVNVQDKDYESGIELFKYEPMDVSNGNRFNVDIYRQKGAMEGFKSSNSTLDDKIRQNFDVEGLMKKYQNELVSRQEIEDGHYGFSPLSLLAGGAAGYYLGSRHRGHGGKHYH